MPAKQENIAGLPKWARNKIEALEVENKAASAEIAALQAKEDAPVVGLALTLTHNNVSYTLGFSDRGLRVDMDTLFAVVPKDNMGVLLAPLTGA